MIWFKKIVRAILALLPVFSVVFLTTPTNALKYSIGSISLQHDTTDFAKIYDYSTNQSVWGYYRAPSSFGFRIPQSSDTNINFPHIWHFNGYYDRATNDCELRQYSDGVSRTVSSSSGTVSYGVSFGGTTFDAYTLPPDFFLNQPNGSFFRNSDDSDESRGLCTVYNYQYMQQRSQYSSSDSGAPTWDWGSLINIPLVNNRFSYEDSKPYFYQFNGIALNSTAVSSGYHLISNGTSMAQIAGHAPDKLNYMVMPFRFFKDPTINLSYGSPEPDSTVRTMIVDGYIDFEEDYTLNQSTHSGIFLDVNNYYDPDFHSSGTTHYTLNGEDVYQLSGRESTFENRCDVEEHHNTNNDGLWLHFQCSYTPSDPVPIDFNFLDVRLSFDSNTMGGDLSQVVLQTSGDYLFHDFSLVTNNDWTPTDWGSTPAVTGGNTDEAPGGVNDSSQNAEVDWFSSLTNLFSFTFINPFSPIFTMFAGDDSCASIPTIAGMIHSEETSVCHWFPSSVRSIVTPVLSLASMMLLFGFAVRWLGSRSGNFVEDSGGVDSGGLHFQNKYRRNK